MTKFQEAFYLALFASLVILAAAIVFAELTTREFVEDSGRVLRTQEIRFTAAKALAQAADAETSTRGYVITGNTTFLVPYTREIDQLRSTFERLRALLQEDPGQLARLEAIGPPLNAKIDAMRKIVQTRRSDGMEAASAIIRAGESQILMEQIRAGMAEIDAEENRLLSVRNARNAELARTTLMVGRSAIVIAFSAIILAAATFYRHERKRQELQADLDRFFNISPDLFCIAGYDGRLLKVNSSWQRVLGLQPEELKGVPFLQFVHPEDVERTKEETSRLAHGERSTSFENRYRGADGSYRWLMWNAVPLLHPRVIYAAARDVTDRKKAEMELLAAADKLQMAAEASERQSKLLTELSEMKDTLQSAEGTAEAYRTIEKYGPQFLPSLSGAVYRMSPSKDVLESMCQWGASRPPVDVFAPQNCLAMRRGRMHLGSPEMPITCTHAEAVNGQYLCIPLVALSETIGVLHLRRDDGGMIAEEEQRLGETMAEQMALTIATLTLRETLRAQSIRDPLTNLFNRRHLEESLGREIRRAVRKNTPFAVLMLDMDHFKQVNDVFGHEAGDAALRAAADCFRSKVRFEDIVCRFGGEEFAILLPEANIEQAYEIADRIRTAVQRLRVSQNSRIIGPLSVSVGLAMFPDHGDTSEKLFKEADDALYAAKSSGRNQVIVACSDRPLYLGKLV